MQTVYAFLKGIEDGTVTPGQPTSEEPVPQKIDFKKFFKKNEVVCMICNKSFKTLKRHLSKAHGLTPKDYKKQFNIPAKYNLIATAYSAERKKAALDRGQGDILAKARAVRAAKKAVVTPAPVQEGYSNSSGSATKAPTSAPAKASCKESKLLQLKRHQLQLKRPLLLVKRLQLQKRRNPFPA